MPVVPQGNYSKTTTATKTALATKTAAGGTKGTTATAAAKAAAAKKLATPVKKTSPAPVKQPIKTVDPIVQQPVVNSPVVEAPVEPAAQWTLETDPLYQMALAGGQSEFNYARNAALADKQGQESMAAGERKALDTGATESRRRLAGNYAARGMAGGAAGALSQAEARANAEQIAARTSIQNKLDALNQQFLSNYGAVGSDWTGTLAGQQYKSQAAQQALSAQLARYGSI